MYNFINDKYKIDFLNEWLNFSILRPDDTCAIGLFYMIAR